ncbi:MAG: GntR family transcriptional regulator [Armatimonadota bacterium]|nr:GntR family transcriptional regulator [Armatimonadota bacterium]MDW8143733.1 GntR family transcriptional regulator [Armatimonadota bacterium]
MKLVLKRAKGLGLIEQLVEQIRYSIATGQLKPGDQLPPGRVLAHELGIHPNTVFAVYRQLEREGLLVLRQGSGAYVAPFSRDHLKRSEQERLEKAISTLVELVHAGLVSQDELKRMIDERLQSIQKTKIATQVAFVECNFEQMETCCAQLEQVLGTKVEPVLLDEAKQNKQRLRSFPLVVTTYFHLREAYLLTSKGQKVVPVFSVPSRKALEAMANLPAKTRLGVICRDKVSLPTIVQQVHQLSGIEPTLSAWLGDRKGVRKVLTECDAIAFMPPCRSKVLAIAPKGKTLIEFEHEIDQSSLEEVKQVFEQLSVGRSL